MRQNTNKCAYWASGKKVKESSLLKGLTDNDVASNHAAGHVCGDNVDMIDGRPTGSIRVSFGYFSDESDADKVIDVIRKNFVETR